MPASLCLAKIRITIITTATCIWYFLWLRSWVIIARSFQGSSDEWNNHQLRTFSKLNDSRFHAMKKKYFMVVKRIVLGIRCPIYTCIYPIISEKYFIRNFIQICTSSVFFEFESIKVSHCNVASMQLWESIAADPNNPAPALIQKLMSALTRFQGAAVPRRNLADLPFALQWSLKRRICQGQNVSFILPSDRGQKRMRSVHSATENEPILVNKRAILITGIT